MKLAFVIAPGVQQREYLAPPTPTPTAPCSPQHRYIHTAADAPAVCCASTNKPQTSYFLLQLEVKKIGDRLYYCLISCHLCFIKQLCLMMKNTYTYIVFKTCCKMLLFKGTSSTTLPSSRGKTNPPHPLSVCHP